MERTRHVKEDLQKVVHYFMLDIGRVSSFLNKPVQEAASLLPSLMVFVLSSCIRSRLSIWVLFNLYRRHSTLTIPAQMGSTNETVDSRPVFFFDIDNCVRPIY